MNRYYITFYFNQTLHYKIPKQAGILNIKRKVINFVYLELLLRIPTIDI